MQASWTIKRERHGFAVYGPTGQMKCSAPSRERAKAELAKFQAMRPIYPRRRRQVWVGANGIECSDQD